MLFWLRDFASNLLANFVAGFFGPADMIGYLIGFGFLIWAAVHWHRRERAAKRLGMASWYFILPCLVVGIAAIVGVAFGLGLRSANPPKADPAPHSAALAVSRNAYLKDAYIYPGANGINPHFSAKLTRNVDRGRIFADDSWWPNALGMVTWTARRRIFLAEIKDFVAEQSFNVPIVTSVTGLTDDKKPSPEKLWRWGDGTTDPHFIYSTGVMHRGRMVFIGDDGPPEYFYFIIPAAPADQVPNIIGQQDLTFMQQWEAEDASKQ
jgi:hypothetical protein